MRSTSPWPAMPTSESAFVYIATLFYNEILKDLIKELTLDRYSYRKNIVNITSMMASLFLVSRQAKLAQSILIRQSSSIALDKLPEHKSLVLQKFGGPLTLMVQKPRHVLPRQLESEQVLVEHLMSCINPNDTNTMQGTYGKPIKLPAVIGNEGVTRVMQVGSDVRHIKPGDLAIGLTSTNYWQTHSVQDSKSFIALPSTLAVEHAAQLRVNPCSAYRMLKDFCDLKPNDVVVQNGANSAVGVYVIQLAKLWGFRTINVIRDRPGKEQLISELNKLGADHIVTDTDIAKVEVVKGLLDKLGKPKLFLNCVGGKNAQDCQRLVADEGTTVTYGAMSKQPFGPSTSSLIFKGHKHIGFWLSRWLEKNVTSGRSPELSEMINQIADLFIGGKLLPKRAKVLSFEQRDEAFSGSSDNIKYMFRINEEASR